MDKKIIAVSKIIGLLCDAVWVAASIKGTYLAAIYFELITIHIFLANRLGRK